MTTPFPTMRFAARVLLPAAVILLAWGACAAPPAADAAANGAAAANAIDDDRIEELLRLHHTTTDRVRLVLLPTSVTDKKGRIVRGLTQDHFTVFEDRVQQTIKVFSSEATEPISIAFLLDVSGSMRQLDKLEHAKEAIRYVVGQLGPRDKMALICFADEQVTWVTQFTTDRETFLKRLSVQTGYGQTALNDAVAAAPKLVDDAAKGRKAIVLVTDGVDNSSLLSTAEAVALARKVAMPIYTIGFLSVEQKTLPKGVTRTNLAVLDRVASETGGRLFPVSGPTDLKEAMAYLDAELRFQYLIGYYSKAEDVQAFHEIRMEVRPERLNARTRKGYYSTP